MDNSNACANVTIISVPELRPTFPIRTERLLLRPLTIADSDQLLAYRRRPDVYRYLPGEPLTPESLAERLAGVWSATALTDENEALGLGVELAGTGELVGDVVLFWRSREHLGGEIGWVFNPTSAAGVTPPKRRARCSASASPNSACTGSSPGWTSGTRPPRTSPAASACARRRDWWRTSCCKGEWSTELQFGILDREFLRYPGSPRSA